MFNDVCSKTPLVPELLPAPLSRCGWKLRWKRPTFGHLTPTMRRERRVTEPQNKNAAPEETALNSVRCEIILLWTYSQTKAKLIFAWMNGLSNTTRMQAACSFSSKPGLNSHD
jgi:hypothetical protein